MFKNVLRRLDIYLDIEIELVFPVREPASDRINKTSHEEEVCFFQDSRELPGEQMQVRKRTDTNDGRAFFDALLQKCDSFFRGIGRRNSIGGPISHVLRR